MLILVIKYIISFELWQHRLHKITIVYTLQLYRTTKHTRCIHTYLATQTIKRQAKRKTHTARQRQDQTRKSAGHIALCRRLLHFAASHSQSACGFCCLLLPLPLQPEQQIQFDSSRRRQRTCLAVRLFLRLTNGRRVFLDFLSTCARSLHSSRVLTPLFRIEFSLESFPSRPHRQHLRSLFIYI